MSILFNNPKSEFENRLLTSIYWFGEALSAKRNNYSKIEKKHSTQFNNLEFFDVYPKLLNIVIRLETLFVFGDENKSEALLNRLEAAGRALTDPDDHNTARLVISSGDVTVRAKLNNTMAARRRCY